jgi:hypothetical protein
MIILKKYYLYFYYILHPLRQSAVRLDDKFLTFGGGLKIACLVRFWSMVGNIQFPEKIQVSSIGFGSDRLGSGGIWIRV